MPRVVDSQGRLDLPCRAVAVEAKGLALRYVMCWRPVFWCGVGFMSRWSRNRADDRRLLGRTLPATLYGPATQWGYHRSATAVL